MISYWVTIAYRTATQCNTWARAVPAADHEAATIAARRLFKRSHRTARIDWVTAE